MLFVVTEETTITSTNAGEKHEAVSIEHHFWHGDLLDFIAERDRQFAEMCRQRSDGSVTITGWFSILFVYYMGGLDMRVAGIVRDSKHFRGHLRAI